MDIQVFRTNASSYQNSDFLKKEKYELEKIPGVAYINSLKETIKDVPFALITNTHTKLNEIPKLILDKTKILIHPNSGYDNFSKDFIQNSDFPIITGNPIRTHAVVEYILSCVFKELSPIENQLHWSSDRQWDRKLLRDQKVLILGHGHIGKLLKTTLSPLVKSLTIYDPKEESQDSDIFAKEFSYDLFKGVDCLIVAASLTGSSKAMVNSQALNQLSCSALIINAARGEIIVEKDLISFLSQQSQAKAYLDVFETEPFAPGYLQKLKNLNKTSHIAGVYKNLNQDIISFEATVLEDFLKNQQRGLSLAQLKKQYSDCSILSPEKSSSLS